MNFFKLRNGCFGEITEVSIATKSLASYLPTLFQQQHLTIAADEASYEWTKLYNELTSEEQNNQDNVRKDSREVHDLARAFDAVYHAGSDNDPGQSQATHQLPIDATHVFPCDVVS